jgi:hypothetical protein
MKTASKVAMISIAAVLATGAAAMAVAKHLHDGQGHAGHGHSADMMAAHAPVSTTSYAELKNTVAELDRAKQATEKYQDVRVAQADGYQILGAEFPGMGAHFVLSLEPKGFDLEKPPILLYHKSTDAPGGYMLAGVGYFYDAPEGPDGQPVNPPFPKSLAHWHKHDNICMLPGLDNPHALSESECRERGGKFVAKTPWLVHVWLWKDNPNGVFTPDNPALH